MCREDGVRSERYAWKGLWTDIPWWGGLDDENRPGAGSAVHPESACQIGPRLARDDDGNKTSLKPL